MPGPRQATPEHGCAAWGSFSNSSSVEIQFTYHTRHPLKACQLVCSHHHGQLHSTYVLPANPVLARSHPPSVLGNHSPTCPCGGAQSREWKHDVQSFVAAAFIQPEVFQVHPRQSRCMLHTFLLPNNIPLFGYTAFSLSFCLDDGHLGSFHFRAVGDNTTVNIHVQVSAWARLAPPECAPAVGWLRPVVAALKRLRNPESAARFLPTSSVRAWETRRHRLWFAWEVSNF